MRVVGHTASQLVLLVPVGLISRLPISSISRAVASATAGTNFQVEVRRKEDVAGWGGVSVGRGSQNSRTRMTSSPDRILAPNL